MILESLRPTVARRLARCTAGALLTLQVLAAATVARDAAAQAPTRPFRLARLFGDGVVLQRGVRIPVWGWAPPRTAVAVRFQGRVARDTADEAGRWSVAFPASTAGGPFTLVADAAGERVSVADVLVGDVWVVSGQSNMEWPLSMSRGGAAAVAAARDSLHREFKVPVSWAEQPAEDLAGGTWAPADAQHAGAFSGVAYFFARELRRTQRVPIGIVNTSWGGSAIETWLGAATLGLDATGPARAMAAERARLDSARQGLVARYGDLRQDAGTVNGRAAWADTALDESAWARIRVPGHWEGQGYTDFDGVAWYRTTFTLSADEAAKGVRLALGAIDDNEVTWVNGVEVGRTSGYNVPRRYDVPATALRAGRNVLAIRVADYGGGGGITGPADSVRLEIGGTSRSLAGEWRFRIGEIGLQMDGQRINKVPSVTYNQMLHPLLPFPIKGVLWYQGESNANDERQARAYREQFRQLVTSWRRAWQPSGSARAFPFLWVQLPNHGVAEDTPSASGGSWAIHREAMQASLALPNTGQAITIDVGDPADIHPTDKQPVGERLARVARRVAYGEAVLASGPTYRSHTVRGNRVTVRFANIGRGLQARGGIEPVGRAGALGAARGSGFAIAGADRRWVWAQVRIERDRVVLWSDQVPNPVAVRYAWAGNPASTLYNSAGLPAAPFRTDNW